MTDRESMEHAGEWREIALPGDVREAQIADLRAMIRTEARPSRQWMVPLAVAAAVALLAGAGVAGWALSHRSTAVITVHCAIPTHESVVSIDGAAPIGSATAFDVCGVPDRNAFNAFTPIACVDANDTIWVWQVGDHATCPTSMRPLA